MRINWCPLVSLIIPSCLYLLVMNINSSIPGTNFQRFQELVHVLARSLNYGF